MKKLKLFTLCFAVICYTNNSIAADAIATGGGVATSLNNTGTSTTIIGNEAGATQIYSGNGMSLNDPNAISINAVDPGVSQNQITVNRTQGNSMYTQSLSGGSVTTNSFITTSSSKTQVGSSQEVSIYSGAISDPSNGNINGTSVITLKPNQATMVSSGPTSSVALAWGEVSGTYTNGIQADSTGTLIQSATAITLSGTTNNISGVKNINTTGNSGTSIGSSGTGSVTITSGTNSLILNNSGTTLTSPTTIVGVTNINSTGTANTSIGNTSGVVSVIGSTINIGSNSSSTVAIGSNSGNSTISLNGNRIQNVGNAVSGTDAVNLNQLNSVSGNVSTLSNQFNSLSNQLQQSQIEYRSGIASVAAMNGLGALNGNQKVNLGLGVGSFGGQAGVAIGGNIKLADNITFKASVATASSNTAASGGFTIGF